MVTAALTPIRAIAPAVMMTHLGTPKKSAIAQPEEDFFLQHPSFFITGHPPDEVQFSSGLQHFPAILYYRELIKRITQARRIVTTYIGLLNGAITSVSKNLVRLQVVHRETEAHSDDDRKTKTTQSTVIATPFMAFLNLLAAMTLLAMRLSAFAGIAFARITVTLLAVTGIALTNLTFAVGSPRCALRR